MKKIHIVIVVLLLANVVVGIWRLNSDKNSFNIIEQKQEVNIKSPHTVDIEPGGDTGSIKKEDYPGLSATDLVDDIAIGWNLGNALECYTSDSNKSLVDQYGDERIAKIETCWGSPQTSQDVIVAVKSAGFDAVRVPVTYRNFLSQDGKIDQLWLERQKQIVDWIIEQDMYCIINIHHDTGERGILKAEQDNYDFYNEVFATVWTQIAEYYIDYDEHLIFEGFNELINDEGDWHNPSKEELQVVNDYNQLFVDTVRATGGYNSYRALICNTYAASSGEVAINGFIVPNDSIPDRIIVSVHNYENIDGFEKAMKRLDRAFVSKGIPCIVGEMGTKPNPKREKYATDTVLTAKKYGIPCFWWDDVGISDEADDFYNYALMNRRNAKWIFIDVVDALMSTK